MKERKPTPKPSKRPKKATRSFRSPAAEASDRKWLREQFEALTVELTEPTK